MFNAPFQLVAMMIRKPLEAHSKSRYVYQFYPKLSKKFYIPSEEVQIANRFIMCTNDIHALYIYIYLFILFIYLLYDNQGLMSACGGIIEVKMTVGVLLKDKHQFSGYRHSSCRLHKKCPSLTN